MQISTLRDRVTERALDFAWNSWAQMGVFAEVDVEDERAADPEALLVFTFEVARRDARLFDEVLDWLRVNERLVSVQRMRNFSRDERDRLLVDAVLRWVSQFRKNPRFGAGAERPSDERESLFGGSTDVWTTDPYFLELGFVRGPAQPSFKSRRPDVDRPINFAFRLRLAFGAASRSEVLRCLLSNPAPHVSAQVVSEFAGYAKRNVAEALDSLVAAGLVSHATVGNEGRYSIDRESWLALLGLESFPGYCDWPQLLRAVRDMIRWLDDSRLDELSDSMRASAARDLIERIERDLSFAGVPVLGKSEPGAAYWPAFVATVEAALDKLHPAFSARR